jgi:hypothetical protein
MSELVKGNKCRLFWQMKTASRNKHISHLLSQNCVNSQENNCHLR